MSFTLPDLPYAHNALAPHISEQTLQFHHDKHHATYVTNLNNLVKDTPLAEQSLEAVIFESAGDAAKAGIFNNAAQVWNHTFYWHSMAPDGGGTPSGALAAKIDEDFGSFDAFVEAFKTAGAGPGWCWTRAS